MTNTQTRTNKPTTKKAIPPMGQEENERAVAAQATAREVAIPQVSTSLSDWGAPTLTSKDIMIPKILVMQAMSKRVTEGAAKFGDFRDSLNDTVVGDITKPFDFVPFYMEKAFIVMVEEKGKFNFKKQVPITSENEDHEYEVTGEDGRKEKWYRTQLVYVLLPKEVEDGTAIPYVLSFRSSSSKAGNKIATTMFMKNPKAGKTPASMTLELSGAKTSNDKGTYVVLDVKEKRVSTAREVEEAFEWVKTIKAGSVKVDHSDLATEGVSESVTAAPDREDY